MIKKIGIDQLKPGMFVHDLNCGWMDHPFARNRFRLGNGGQLAKIRKLGVRDLYIDTSRGLDVHNAPTAPEIKQQLERHLRQTVKSPVVEEKETGLAEEQGRAGKIRQEASQVVTGMMEDARLGRQLEVERINPLMEKMVGSIFRNKDALLGLTRIRRMDRYTFEHSVGVAVLMVSFARTLGMDRDCIREIGVGALLHDIGKTLVPPEILNKPGSLTDEEFVIMRGHVVHSRKLLEGSKGISPIALGVAQEHHERMDGSGYPAGKKGDEISRYGQMAAIVDVYDAITSERVYHKGMEPHLALRKLLEWSKYHLNHKLTQNFIRCLGIYPIGTLVRLQSERIGVVVESRDSNLLLPVVRVMMDARRRSYLTPKDLDLSTLSGDAQDRIVGAEEPKNWPIDIEKELLQQA